jgi:hypothetical protein
METTMSSNESKNEMLVMVLIDLAAICQKLTENSVVPEELRMKAHQLVEEFNLLLPYRGKGTDVHHFHGERLIEKIARFLPRLLEVQAQPAVVSNE